MRQFFTSTIGLLTLVLTATNLAVTNQTYLPKIEQFISSQDPETRFMGLFFLAKLIDQGQELEPAAKIVTGMLDDQDVIVQTQIMWLLGKLVSHGYLSTVAVTYASQAAQSSDPTVRLWAGELLTVLVQKDLALNIAQQFLIAQQHTQNNLQLLQLSFLAEQLKQSSSSAPVKQSGLAFNADGGGDALAIYQHKSATDQLTLITTILKSPDWRERYWGLYFLAKLVDQHHELDRVEDLVQQALTDVPTVQIQAMWVLTKLVAKDRSISIALAMTQQAVTNPDWHVRFGGLMLLTALRDKCEKQVLAPLWDRYQADAQVFVKFYLQS